MSEEKEYYIRTLECLNCGARGTVEIPKGITIKDFALVNDCQDCGCQNALYDVETK